MTAQLQPDPCLPLLFSSTFILEADFDLTISPTGKFDLTSLLRLTESSQSSPKKESRIDNLDIDLTVFSNISPATISVSLRYSIILSSPAHATAHFQPAIDSLPLRLSSTAQWGSSDSGDEDAAVVGLFFKKVAIAFFLAYSPPITTVLCANLSNFDTPTYSAVSLPAACAIFSSSYSVYVGRSTPMMMVLTDCAWTSLGRALMVLSSWDRGVLEEVSEWSTMRMCSMRQCWEVPVCWRVLESSVKREQPSQRASLKQRCYPLGNIFLQTWGRKDWEAVWKPIYSRMQGATRVLIWEVDIYDGSWSFISSVNNNKPG